MQRLSSHHTLPPGQQACLSPLIRSTTANRFQSCAFLSARAVLAAGRSRRLEPPELDLVIVERQLTLSSRQWPRMLDG